MYQLFISSESKFLISNDPSLPEFLLNSFHRVSSAFRLVSGYLFLNHKLIKSGDISKDEFEAIADGIHSVSGIFIALELNNNQLRMCLDPLIQYNLFYTVIRGYYAISNDIFALAALSGNIQPCTDHLLDIICYQSTMRGLTPIKNIYTYQFHDLLSEWRYSIKPLPPIKDGNLTLLNHVVSPYDGLKYDELIALYRSRLLNRAEIVSNSFDRIEVALTGGADSRLATSSFISYPNVQYFCFGDGSSQDRLTFESLLSAFGLNKAERVVNIGTFSSVPDIIKSLIDTNLLKLWSHNYINGTPRLDPNEGLATCLISGYYGANICGSVPLPLDRAKIGINPRTNIIPKDCFTHFGYLEAFTSFASRLGWRKATTKDIFYLSNRGLSHYAAHSLASNRHGSQIDILYDRINLSLVESCPYDDHVIDLNAISVEVIASINPGLALFPYNSRKVPRFNTTLCSNAKHIWPNCFDGYTFDESEIANPMLFSWPKVNSNAYVDYLDVGLYHSLEKLFEHPVANELKHHLPCLSGTVIDTMDATSRRLIALFFLSLIVAREHTCRRYL